MTKATITVPSRSYVPGTRTVNLPDLTMDDLGVKISLTRESWPDTGGDIISGLVEGSDDGVNWSPLVSFAYPGGNQINPRTGQPVLACGPTVYWPEKNINGTMTPQRPAQARVTVTNITTLTTAITVAGA